MLYLVDYFVDGQLEGWGQIEAENQWDALEKLAQDLVKEEPSKRKRMSSVIVGDSQGRYDGVAFSNESLWVEGRDLIFEK